MPLPVTLITGYLGAGKTTLLDHLLGMPPWSERRLALVINEFSTLGVDGKRLRPTNHACYEINRGSVFCTCTQTEFLQTLQEIAALGSCDEVLLEATGISETSDLESYFDVPGLRGRFAVRGNLCLVDARHFVQVAAMLPAVQSQVEAADLLVVNQTDLVSPPELVQLQAVLTRMNPRASQIVTTHGRIAADAVEGLSHRPCRRLALTRPPEAIVSAAVQTECPVDRDRFLAALVAFKGKLLRLKGNIDFGQGPRYVELVADQLREGDACAGLPRGTAFSAIAWQMSSAELRQMLEEACSAGVRNVILSAAKDLVGREKGPDSSLRSE